MLTRIIWVLGIRSDYRSHFWKMAWREFKKGDIDNIFQISIVAHHLISYSRDCLNGKMHSSNYSRRVLEKEKPLHENAIGASPVGSSI
jgi:hopanoid C-2 methylase